MTQKKFNLSHKAAALFTLVVSAITYLLTIEPSASFWDCGEFIASSYKLEVGHPPGNPVFQLIARFFTLFGDNMHAAVLVNAMSALCSALTIFFLYLTIAWFAKRLVRKGADGEYTAAQAVSIIGSGVVGALVYAFSDTFWFSAVEGEVYAMSSLFTAAVFWAMTMWYDRADRPHSGKWIVLIAFLMGLSIGVHLLNLLAIPALVFMFFYRRREDRGYTFVQYLGIFAVGVVILALILFGIIPLLPKTAAHFDKFFVNTLGLPYNSGAAFFLVLVLALCFVGMFATLRRGKVFWNTALLCLTSIIIGFSIFSIDIIRSCAKTPTNEYQPDNAFTLVRYLNREQYGTTPLLYGQYYDADLYTEPTTYYAPLGGQYKEVQGAPEPVYEDGCYKYDPIWYGWMTQLGKAPSESQMKTSPKMLFPRMWSSAESHAEFYRGYTLGGPDEIERFETFRDNYNYYAYKNNSREDRHMTLGYVKDPKPTQAQNLAFFIDYQLKWMYLRYFMWNFVGRQNEIHGPQRNFYHGNWESGIGFLDNIRLTDQSDAPSALADNKGKNHYFFLPLLLGLIGLFFQFDRDKRGCWLTFLMFFMTGIAIVLYLNQPPFQVRERDYAYAGSFYFFSVWCGLAVAGICEIVKSLRRGKESVAAGAAVAAVCLLVPVQMAGQNWDDHDRSGRRTAVEMARNYLNSVGENGILVTHGDNDTFPLWYAQEVEDVRTDVRICNTSLLGTDWHIDQMKWACNESAPLALSIGPEQYLYGTNEYVLVDPKDEDRELTVEEVIRRFKDPKDKYLSRFDGQMVDYIAARKISVPVNVENVRKYILKDYEGEIPDRIVLTISKDKNYITKPELFMLDLLSRYQWDRPLHLLSMGGDLNMGIKEYLEYEGYSYKFVPIKNKTTTSKPGFVEPEELYRLMTEVYTWDAVAAPDYFIDYQNLYTHLGVMSLRHLFTSCAEVFERTGHADWAVEMLSKCVEVTARYPWEGISLGFAGNDQTVIQMIGACYRLGQVDLAREIADKFEPDLLQMAAFATHHARQPGSNFEYVLPILDQLSLAYLDGGDAERAEALDTRIREYYDDALGCLQTLLDEDEIEPAYDLTSILARDLEYRGSFCLENFSGAQPDLTLALDYVVALQKLLVNSGNASLALGVADWFMTSDTDEDKDDMKLFDSYWTSIRYFYMKGDSRAADLDVAFASALIELEKLYSGGGQRYSAVCDLVRSYME